MRLPRSLFHCLLVSCAFHELQGLRGGYCSPKALAVHPAAQPGHCWLPHRRLRQLARAACYAQPTTACLARAPLVDPRLKLFQYNTFHPCVSGSAMKRGP